MLSDKLKYIEKNSNYSMEQLANWFSVPLSTYKKWHYGVNKPPAFYQHSINALYDQVKRNKDEKLEKYFALSTAGLLALGAWWLFMQENEGETEPEELTEILNE